MATSSGVTRRAAQSLSIPVAANGGVYFESSDGNVYAVNAQTESFLWTGTTESGLLDQFRPPQRPEPASLQPDSTLKPYLHPSAGRALNLSIMGSA
jgi:hypothetical protein